MSKKLTIAQWLFQWLNTYVKSKNERKTYLCYETTIKMILRHNPSYAYASLDQPTELEMQEMINLLHDCHYAKSTLEKARTVMRQSYETAIRNQLCQHNPALSLHIPPHAKQKVVVALTQEEQNLLEQAAAKDRLGHLVIFYLRTGLRSSELSNLTWSDYFPAEKKIYISKSKTKNGIRYIPLVPEAQSIIESQPKISKFIFTSSTGNPITETVLKKLYLRMRESTGLDFITTHFYRHSFATRLVERGVEYKALSQILGHSDVSFTLKRYTRPDFLFLQDQISLISSKKSYSGLVNDINTQAFHQILTINQNLFSRVQQLEDCIGDLFFKINQALEKY